MAVLFEHAAHPVIVPHTSKLTSADFPGAAVKRIREELGEDVIALFGQGCGGNINGYPLRSTHENADNQGHKLGDAVLQAMKESTPIQSQTLSVKFAQSELPSHPLPAKNCGNRWPPTTRTMNAAWGSSRRCATSWIALPRRPRGVWTPTRWGSGGSGAWSPCPTKCSASTNCGLTKTLRSPHTMTFAYTNGYQGYVAIDEAWRMGAKGGYEAASLPNWGGQVWTEHFGPPAVGSEKIVKDTVASLWPKDA